MTVEQWIKVNQKIRVSRSEEREDWYDSSIQDVGQEKFYIAVPYQRAIPLILNNGEQVNVNIVLKEARIEFKSTVLGRRVDNIPLFALSWPDSYARVQQRKFVRLPVMLDVFYAEVPEEGKEPEFIKSCTLDISGGGARILAGKNFAENTGLLLKLYIPKGGRLEEIAVSGRVVRTCEADTGAAIHAAVEFIDITSRQQDLIVNFTLNEIARSRRLR